MAAPFEVSKLWREAMQCVSINANLYPQQILHKYYDFFPTQSALHPGYVELDIWRSKRATERGVKLVQICYLDNDPSKIHLMVIFIDALDPNTKRSIIRLVTNTSLHHVLEEPYANCPLWLKVHSDVGPHADSPYQIIPCCDQWVESVDFDGPISSEEKQVPAMVARLVDEVKRKNLLLHAKEREIEAKDDQLRHLRGQDRPDMDVDVDAAPTMGRLYPQRLHHIDMEAFEQYWWVAAIIAVTLVMFALK